MSETLQARLGIPSPGANLSPKKAWKKAKQNPYVDDHRDSQSWPSHCTSPSYEPDGGPHISSQVSPSLIDRLGPKVAPPPRSLLERMELEDSDAAEAAATGGFHSSDSSCMSVDAVPYFKVGREEDGDMHGSTDGRSDAYRDASDDGELMADIRSAKYSTRARPSWDGNGFPTETTHSLARAAARPADPLAGEPYRTRSANSERVRTLTSEAAVVEKLPDSNNNPSMAAPEIPATTNHPAPDTSESEFAQSDPRPTKVPQLRTLPLQARIGRVLRSAVFQNAKLRETNRTMNAEKVQSKINDFVTENMVESFGAQMRKVKQEMDASRVGRQTEQVMARAKDDLLNGFGSKSGTGGYTDNTWLNRRDSHSLMPSLASTSILPTPPPSESLPAEDMTKAPPKAPKAMLGIYSPHLPPKSISLKGKEKAIEPPEDGRRALRERRNSYSFNSLRGEPMRNVPPDSVPRNSSLRQRSPHRRASASPSRSPARRSFADEMPMYRSPPPSRTPHSLPGRRGPLRSRSRSHVRTDSNFTTRPPLQSPSRSPPRRQSPRSRSRPRRAVSHTHSFNSRRPSLRSSSRSPPPSAHSNGFSHRAARSRSPARYPSRARAFSGNRPPPSHRSRSRSPILNSRHPPEKRPFVRSPSPYGPRSAHGPRSRSPLPRKRKLTHPSPPRSRSPWRRRSPSIGPSEPRGRLPLRPGAPNATPRTRNPTRGYEDSPMQLLSPFGPQPPPAARALHSSPLSPPRPPPASNPCNNIPGLWFVKVGADAPQVVECTFVVEPGFAYMWGIQPPDESTAAANPTPNAKLRVVLLCLPTAAVITLYDSLRAAAPTPEGLAAAVAGLATAWPLDGTLILDMNRAGGGGNAWLPRDMDPTAPLDVTNYIRPGPNVIRFIQLASMLEHTFILYASPRESVNGPPQNAARDMDVDDDDAVPVQTGGMLFDFCATVTVS